MECKSKRDINLPVFKDYKTIVNKRNTIDCIML